MKYWVNTVSRDHVQVGRQGSFVQAGHGKKAPLVRLSKGDFVVFYSPRTSLKDGAPHQRFTAVAEVADERIYQVEVSEDFQPFRRDATYLDCEEADIRPLIPTLSFIKDKTAWGSVFRFGLREIPQADFSQIILAMRATRR
jgi:predicted RNA-binding protein